MYESEYDAERREKRHTKRMKRISDWMLIITVGVFGFILVAFTVMIFIMTIRGM